MNRGYILKVPLLIFIVKITSQTYRRNNLEPPPITTLLSCPQIEKLDPLTGQWMPCGESKTPEYDVTGLQEGKKYKFRVKAVNAEGESEPLEAEQAIVAKNPFGEDRFYS